MRLFYVITFAVLTFIAAMQISAGIAQIPALKPEPAPVVIAAAAPAPAPVEAKAAPAPAAVSQGKVTWSQTNVEGPYIAITFDDGPSAENTPRLLNMLKERGVKATFFCLGECVANNPDIAKRIVAEGHEIASHSWNHPQLNKMGEDSVHDQLQRTHDVIRQTTGATVTVFRPPYGAFTQRQQRWANGTWGYKVILWDVDPLDWKYRSASHVEGEILKGTHAGSIILAHDIHKSTVDAMPGTLDGLLQRGFKFVTVSELLKMDRPAAPKDPKAPKTPGAATPAAAPAATTPPAPVTANAQPAFRINPGAEREAKP